MVINISKELNPIFEIIGLMCVGYNYTSVKEETLKELNKLGLDGELFYKNHYKIHEKYLKLFLKCRTISSDDDIFFKDCDIKFCIFLFGILMEDENGLTLGDNSKDSDIRRRILNDYKFIYESSLNIDDIEDMQNIISFLDKSDLDENIKWKLIRILSEPKIYYKKLQSIIDKNIDAFNKVIEEIKNPLDKLIHGYSEAVNNDETFKNIVSNINETPRVYPSLIFATAQVISEDYCFYGLLSNFILKVNNKYSNSKNELLSKLKAISDGSKLDILSFLKISPKYSLEIAEKLGLTAATVSYHMSTLLTCKMVQVEKKDGKIYYNLDKDNIKNFIEDIEKVLL